MVKKNSVTTYTEVACRQTFRMHHHSHRPNHHLNPTNDTLLRVLFKGFGEFFGQVKSVQLSKVAVSRFMSEGVGISAVQHAHSLHICL